jgi:hypothetical protein
VSQNPLTRLLKAFVTARVSTYGAARDLVLRAEREARSLRFADAAATLSLVDGLPASVAAPLEQALSDLGVDLS